MPLIFIFILQSSRHLLWERIPSFNLVHLEVGSGPSVTAPILNHGQEQRQMEPKVTFLRLFLWLCFILPV